jgi:hypothetical protein
MTIDDQIKTLFDLDTLTYYKNKRNGGNANQKGGRYEDFFSIMELAKLFHLVFNSTQQDVEIHAQADAFVDDLLISNKFENAQHHFQLKNTASVAWGKGAKSISDDFYKQKLLNDNIGIKNTRTILVCSEENKVNSLKNKKPKNIADFSDVIFFPSVETVNQLLLSHSEFRDAIKAICFSKQHDKLEALAKIILGHWCDKKTTLCSAKTLLDELRGHFPNHLTRIITLKLLPEVEAIFSKISNFDYCVNNGYFSWEYSNGLDSGVLLYPVDSTQFYDFQQVIITQQPNQFSELESLLLWTDNSQSM